MNRKRILWITQTAIFIALLVSAQAVTRPMGQFVTGPIVNFILITSGIVGGLSSAGIVAILSPMFAFFFGIGPVFPQLIPFIMLGNFAQVTAFCLIAGRSFDNLNISAYIRIGSAAAASSVLKFLVLWVGVTQIALSLFQDIIPPPAANNLAAMFSWPQLVTALIGSSVAVIVMPVLVRALKHTAAAEIK